MSTKIIFLEGPDNSFKTSTIYSIIPLAIYLHKNIIFLKEPFIDYDFANIEQHLTLRYNIYKGIARNIQNGAKYIIDRSFVSHLVYNLYLQGVSMHYIRSIIITYKRMLQELNIFNKIKIIIMLREEQFKDKEYYNIAMAYITIANELISEGFNIEIISFYNSKDIHYKLIIQELTNFIELDH